MVARSLAEFNGTGDPAVIGRELARALGTIVCRCVHPRRVTYPCDSCAQFGRAYATSLGRLLFSWAQGAPYGQRPPSPAEYDEVGRLLEECERVAAGKLPRIGGPTT